MALSGVRSGNAFFMFTMFIAFTVFTVFILFTMFTYFCREREHLNT